MKKILITGGAGFIGSHLALKLTSFGYTVTVLDNLSKQIHGESPKETSPLYQSVLKANIKFINGTVLNKGDWLKALDNQDVVVHFAAETGTGQSMYEIQKYVDVNIGGTAILLDILANKKHSVKKIIVASSRAIYGEGKYECNEHGVVYPNLRAESNMLAGDFSCHCPICDGEVSLLETDEESKIHPNSIYGITKQNQEQMVMLMGKTLRIPAVALRYQNVYGPGQSLSNPYTGILSIFSNLIRSGKEINIFEDGKESRDFVYIDDVVDATILAIENGKANYNIYNVGSKERIDVKNVAEVLTNAYGKDKLFKITGNFRLGDIRHNIADISRIERDLGYSPKYTFSIGIKKFVEWVFRQEVKESSFDNSINEMKAKGLFK